MERTKEWGYVVECWPFEDKAGCVVLDALEGMGGRVERCSSRDETRVRGMTSLALVSELHSLEVMCGIRKLRVHGS